MRANAIHLSSAQRWQVAKFCIENRGVVQDQGGKFTIWRVSISTLVKEWNEEHADYFMVTTHALKQSVEFYNEICELTNNLPEVPKVENDEVLKLQEEIKLRDNTIAVLQSSLANTRTVVENLLGNMREIRQIASSNGKTPEVKKLHRDNGVKDALRT